MCNLSVNLGSSLLCSDWPTAKELLASYNYEELALQHSEAAAFELGFVHVL